MKRSRDQEECEVDVTNCLMLLTKVGEISETNPSREIRDGFKCKTCNKRFSSFQALGGHRASHKKPKLMVADLPCNHRELSKTAMKHKMHPCPICGVEFAIGQALGGHMRKHRGAINDYGLMIHKHALPISKKSKESKSLNLCLDLNLNLTPSENDIKLNLMTPVLNCFV